MEYVVDTGVRSVQSSLTGSTQLLYSLCLPLIDSIYM